MTVDPKTSKEGESADETTDRQTASSPDGTVRDRGRSVPGRLRPPVAESPRLPRTFEDVLGSPWRFRLLCSRGRAVGVQESRTEGPLTAADYIRDHTGHEDYR